ncbi:MAG: hypothetical protein VKK04_22220 [Synechococcales bacterium]|nr:hypothetical protein [Synechococcales bacterium]
MKRIITAILSTAVLVAFAAPSIALEGRHQNEFQSGLGNKLSDRHQDEFESGLGNKLSQ